VADNPKAYDQAFKSLSDVDPRGLLDIFGILPHEVDAEVEPLPRDIAARPLVVDTGYFVRPARGDAFIAVFEALTSWKRDTGARLASYGGALGDRYQMPVRVYALPMAKHACPARTPAFGKAEWGDVEVRVRLRWLKPWLIDASVVLERNSPNLDPWAVLFDCSPVQIDEVANRLKNRPRDAGLFRILGGMRYRKSIGQWKELLKRINPMITREMMRESLAVQEWLDEGRQEGLEKGLQKGLQQGLRKGLKKGRVEEARLALLAVIEARFPSLSVHNAIEAISDLDVLNSLIRVVAKAPDASAVSRAIDPQFENKF
jgi:hypothetical protein